MLTVHKLDYERGTQYLALDDGGAFVERYPRNFQGKSMLDGWVPWEAYVVNPTAKRGDFFGFDLGVYAFNAAIAETFADLFAVAGELLPILVDGEQHFLLNVLRAPAALDRDASQWRMLLEKPVHVTRYAFHPAVVASESIFRVAEQAGVVVAVSGQDDSRLDFYSRYRALNLSGLSFTPIWSSST